MTIRKISVVSGLVMLAVMMAGCTLSGTGAVPLTPPAEMGNTASNLLPTPTEVSSANVFATQTFQSQQVEEPTAEPTEVPVEEEATEEPAEEAEATEEPTEEASEEPTEEPTEEPAEEETPEPTQEPGEDCSYTVDSGDTLFNIALSFGLTLEDLASANGITDPDTLDVGDELTIPNCGGTGGSAGTVTGAGDTVYTVQPGDNLFRIALAYGIAWEDLAAYNGITDVTTLSVGQEILIPGS